MIKVNELENYNSVKDKYYVTTCGKIIIVQDNNIKIMKPNINKKGYHQYRLITKNGNGDCVRPYVHKLVALAYIKNDNIEKNQVDHLDMNKEHNYVGNLEWVTNAENMKRRNKMVGYTGGKLSKEDIQYIKDNYKIWRDGKIWRSTAKDMAQKFNVDPKTITNVVNGLSYKY